MPIQKRVQAESHELHKQFPNKSVYNAAFDESLHKDISRTIDEQGNEQVLETPEDKLPPVYINGEPHFIIRGKYVPYDEGRIVFQERLINQEVKKLEYLKKMADHNKRLKEFADGELAKAKEASNKKREEENKRLKEKHDKEMGGIQTY
jgi:hypothetical protein